MLTCIACSKQLGGSLQHEAEEDEIAGTPGTRQAIKALTSQIKDIALKASGAYRHCKPCAGAAGRQPRHRHSELAESDAASEPDRSPYTYRRAAASSGLGITSASTSRLALGREIEARLRALSSGEVTPSVSRRTEGGVAFAEEDEEEEEAAQREWVAQVEPGVLITFVSLPRGRNDLRRIRFSREMFNRWQAQRWWAENCDKVMELYNVQRFHRQGFPLPTTSQRSEDESSKVASPQDVPETPPLTAERLPRSLQRPTYPGSGGGMMGYSSSDSLDHHPVRRHAGRRCDDTGRLTPTPKLSSLSAGARGDASSVDVSARTSPSMEEDYRCSELSASASNASDQEREWVEQDEPGVFITIRALPGGARELRRVRFSRERFGEMHARLWWEENRARIHQQYL